jgi:hypothetical protein
VFPWADTYFITELGGLAWIQSSASFYTVFISYFCKLDINSILLSSYTFSQQFLTLGLMQERNYETRVNGLQHIGSYRGKQIIIRLTALRITQLFYVRVKKRQ